MFYVGWTIVFIILLMANAKLVEFAIGHPLSPSVPFAVLFWIFCLLAMLILFLASLEFKEFTERWW